MVKHAKITVVGDGTVGKTCMLIAQIEKKFNEDYIPTVFENHAVTMTVDEVEYNVAIWDTAGQEDYERLRPLSYPNTTCFLMCFSIENVTSYENIVTKWSPEVRHHIPNVAIILVGTKADKRLEDNPSLILTSEKDGHKLKKKIKADGYFECSAKHMTGLEEIFNAAVRASAKRGKPRPTRTCEIL